MLKVRDKSKCRECAGECSAWCPTSALTKVGQVLEIDYGMCVECGACLSNCPAGNLELK